MLTIATLSALTLGVLVGLWLAARRRLHCRYCRAQLPTICSYGSGCMHEIRPWIVVQADELARQARLRGDRP